MFKYIYLYFILKASLSENRKQLPSLESVTPTSQLMLWRWSGMRLYSSKTGCFLGDQILDFQELFYYIDHAWQWLIPRYMWIRTTWSTYWNQLREGFSSTYLPGINSAINAAYDIPAKGVAYIFTGNVQSSQGMTELDILQNTTAEHKL